MKNEYEYITLDEQYFLNTSFWRYIPILMVEIGLAWGVCELVRWAVL